MDFAIPAVRSGFSVGPIHLLNDNSEKFIIKWKNDNKQTRTHQVPVDLKDMKTTTIQSGDEVQQVKSTTLRLIGYLQGIRNYLNMSNKSMFRNLLLCLLVLGFSNSKYSNPANCPISTEDGMDLKHKSSFWFASITRSMFNDYISPRLKAFMCFPVHSQKTENTFHDKDNAANKDPPVAGERNSNLRQDDSLLETLYAKDEKEASTDPIHNKTMVREYDRYASFEKYEDKMDSISYSTSRLAVKGFYYNSEKRLCICFECGVEVKQWNETESIDETHRKLSPDCKFINGKDTVNIPFHKLAGCCEGRMHRGGESSESNSIAGAGACSEELIEQTDRLSKFANNQDASNTETYTHISLETATGEQQTKPRDDCMVLAENANYPVYSSKSERTASFLCWRPIDIVSTSSLVDAGLYYTGSGDEVRCFQCGGGLKN
ncbi:hypothetical protein DPMN_055471 [Dreissena polymorpha]|uniref:Apoptosis 1 inhibitor n=1 Tax=Dreissena polymorpha TaxID=45954 RepID=A0A9D4CQ18_DREPO|nr:hypothetical protein DPMN_055471 [Dreissena polymorpha]